MANRNERFIHTCGPKTFYYFQKKYHQVRNEIYPTMDRQAVAARMMELRANVDVVDASSLDPPSYTVNA